MTRPDAPSSLGDDPQLASKPALVAWSNLTWRLLVLVAGLLVLVFAMGLIGPVILALFMAGLFTALASPIMRLLQRAKLPKIVAMILSILFLASAVSVIFVLVVRSVIEEGPKVAASAQAGFAQFQDWLKNGPLQLDDDNLNTVMNELTALAKEIGTQLLDAVGGVLGNAGTFVTAGSVFLFGIVFFMMTPQRIWDFVLSWATPASRRHVDVGGRIAWESLAGYTRGIVVVAFLDALLVFIGLVILQVPLAPVLASLVFLGAFVPVIGAPVATFFAAIVALAERGPLIALLVVVLTIVVGSVDGDVLQPLVMGRAVNLHPLAIVILIAGGAIGFGIIGALVAVPIGSAIYGVLKYVTGRDPDNPFREPAAAPDPAAPAASDPTAITTTSSSPTAAPQVAGEAPA